MPSISSQYHMTLFLAWSVAVAAFLFWSGARNQSFENLYDLVLLTVDRP